MIQGIDVASYQSLDMIRARLGGIGFGFVKATEGTGYVNPIAEAQLALFTHAGKPAGLYHFLRHDKDARAQWRHFLAHVAQHRGSVVIFVDHESDESGLRPSLRLVRAFVRCAHVAGYRIGRYASLSTFYDGQVGADWRLVAKWSGGPPPLSWAFWQTAGSSGLDRDVFAGDIAALHAFWARNSYHQLPPRIRRIVSGGGRLPVSV